MALDEAGQLNTKSKQQSEIDLLFAMLVFNENMDYHQTKDAAKMKTLLSPELVPAAMLLNYSFPTHDITNFHFAEYSYCQTIKSLLLFLFLDGNDEGRGLLQRFYRYYGITHWKEYYERAIPVITAWADSDKASSVDLILADNAQYAANYGFLDKLALSHYIRMKDVDYIKLRERPLIPLDPHTFRIIHPLFVADKIYKGLYFLLKQLNEDGGAVVPGDFRRWYTTDFSEAICFNELIKYAAPKYDSLLFDRDHTDQVVGPPDAYLRTHDYSFLFESKDILINAGIKSRYNFEELLNELKKKLLQEPDGRAVGIGQLIANVRKLLTGENTYDSGFRPDATRIYPVLVTHDPVFDTPALNRLLGAWFQDELQKLKAQGIDTSRVRPLVVMNIDSLIQVSPHLREERLTLMDLYEAYYNNGRFPTREYSTEAERNAAYGQACLSFADFLPHFMTENFGPHWPSEALLQHLFEDPRMAS